MQLLTGGFTANTGLANWCRENGMYHIHRAMHSAVIDRHPKHGIHFRVLAKCLRLSGGDHLHTGTVVGKLEGDRASTLGFVDQLRESLFLKIALAVFGPDWAGAPAGCVRRRLRRYPRLAYAGTGHHFR